VCDTHEKLISKSQIPLR